MILAAFSVLLLLSLSSGESGTTPQLSVVLLRGECEANPLQWWEYSLEEASAGVAAEDASMCSGIDLPVRITPAAINPTGPTEKAAANGELDAVLEVVQPSLSNSSLHTLAVVYLGCSRNLKVLADVLSSRVYQIPLFSFRFPYSPSLTTRNTYHTRLAPDETVFTPTIVTVITQFGWKRVGLLSENTPVFTKLHKDLPRDLERNGVSVHHQLTLDPAPRSLPTDTLTLFGEDVKVFILNVSPRLARAVLCQALHGLTYPGYVWITHGWYGEGWWEDEGEEGGGSVSCTAQQLAAFLESSLAISHYPSWQAGQREEGSGAAGIQPTCLKSGTELANRLLRPTDLQPSLPASVTLVYDAVWTAALAYTTAPLSTYPTIINNNVSFEGSSGPVVFVNGTRHLTYLTLFQYRRVSESLQKVAVATIAPLEGSSQYDITFNEGENPGSMWPNGIPSDGTPIEVEHFPYPVVMGIVYTYSCLGVLFALSCFTFNLVFRKRKLIRLSSPNLNHIIVLGAIISYLAGLTFFYPEGASRTGIIWGCNLRAWTAALGFSVCYGTLNVKMWRVYSICRHPRPSMSKTLIKDYHLMLLVLGFVMVDTIILVVVMSLDNSRFTVITIPNKQDPTPHINEDGIKEVSVVSRCLSTTEPYWLSVLFGYKAIIQAIGLYLAFKIRNIKIRGLNDSREVSITLYVSSVILLIIVIVTFVYGDYIDVDGFVYGFGLSTAATVVLSLTFIPKMVGLYRDPEGKNIFQVPTSTDADPGTEIHYLQRRVKELEKQVELARSQENLLDISTTKSLPIASPPPASSPVNTSSSNSDCVNSSRVQAPSE